MCTNLLSRVVLSGRHREHLSASMQLSNLHWLSVRKRIDFKLALTTFKIRSTHHAAYLRSLLFPYEPMRALHSSSQQLLNVPTVTTDFGRRAFSYCAPKIWNEIPAAIRNAPTVQTFKHQLKTHLLVTHRPSLHMTQPPTWQLPAPQIWSYTPDIAHVVISLHIIIFIIIAEANLTITLKSVNAIANRLGGLTKL